MEFAVDVDAGCRLGGGELGCVLQLVRPRVLVLIVVSRYPVVLKVDRHLAGCNDGVAEDGVAYACVGYYDDPGLGVEGDEVPGAGFPAADDVVRGATCDHQTPVTPAGIFLPVRRRAQIVTPDPVAAGARPAQPDVPLAVGRDDVPFLGGQAADGVVGRFKVNSPSGLRELLLAGGVDPDVVAGYGVVPGRVAHRVDAVMQVAGDDVARQSRRATHQVVGRIHDQNAVVVGDCFLAALVGADVVPLDDVQPAGSLHVGLLALTHDMHAAP